MRDAASLRRVRAIWYGPKGERDFKKDRARFGLRRGNLGERHELTNRQPRD